MPYLCGQTTKLSVIRHLLAEHGIEVVPSYFCRICKFVPVGKAYPLKAVNAHIKTTHKGVSVVQLKAGGSHVCSTCGDSFASKRGLTNHARIHTKPARQNIRAEASQVKSDIGMFVERKKAPGDSTVARKPAEPDVVKTQGPLHTTSADVSSKSASLQPSQEAIDLVDVSFDLDDVPTDNDPRYLEPLRCTSGTAAYLNSSIILNALRQMVAPLASDVYVVDPLVASSFTRDNSLRCLKRIPPSWAYVIFPIHRDGNHWALAFYDRREGTVTYYDSLACKVASVKPLIDAVTSRLPRVHGDKRMSLSSAPIGSYTLQDDSHNCGVFVCLYAEKLLLGRPLSFAQSEAVSWRQRVLRLLSDGVQFSHVTDAVVADSSATVDSTQPNVLSPRGSTAGDASDPINRLATKSKTLEADASTPLSAALSVCDKQSERIEIFLAALTDWQAGDADWSAFEELTEIFVSHCVSRFESNEESARRGIADEVVGKGWCTRSTQTPGARPRFGDKSHAQRVGMTQRLFNSNPKAAMRQVFGQKPKLCNIASAVIEEYFSDLMAPKAFDYTAFEQSVVPWECFDIHAGFTAQVAPYEVLKALKSAKNTAPGDDKVKYRDLLQADPSGEALSAIFNICLSHRRIPGNWKNAVTILLHKKGDEDKLENWRPIAIMRTIYKVYMLVWTKRIGDLAEFNKLFSSEQKGFMPSEGCSEHVFVLDSILHNARSRKRDLQVCWLDLASAFPSVPHDLIVYTLKRFGFPDVFVDVVRDVYTNASTTYKYAGGVTKPVRFGAGVKQGDPLSPLLFNICMEPFIRSIKQKFGSKGYSLQGSSYSILAYADDLVLISNNKQDMRDMLGYACELSATMMLRFRPNKCASLSLLGGKAMPDVHKLVSECIPTLDWSQAYEYLGVPLGVGVDQSPTLNLVDSMKDLHKIEASVLAPWQKLKAIKIFILPRFQYLNRLARVRKSDLAEFDRVLVAAIRKIAHLPPNSSSDYLYGHIDHGGLGFLPATEELEIATLTYAYRLLTSPNDLVRQLAWDSLIAVVTAWIHEDPSEQDITDFLNGCTVGKFRAALTHCGGDPTSVWKRARTLMRDLRRKIKIRFEFVDGDLTLQHEGLSPNGDLVDGALPRKELYKHLRIAVASYHSAKLARCVDQGKTTHAVRADPVNNQFVKDGKFISFAGFKFVHRARLNLVDLNGTRRRHAPDKGGGTAMCRRCGYYIETLPHVLCHCKPQLSKGITQRHDAIQDRVVNAIKRFNPSVKVIVGSECSVAGRNLRPDIVAIDKRSNIVHILDVTCPFENGPDAFKRAREAKRLKYQPEALAFERIGYRVVCDAIVVGALGTWDPSNNAPLRGAGIGHRYMSKMARLVVMDTIAHSTAIYWRHILGNRYVAPKRT